MKTEKVITKVCSDCEGYGELSDCCHALVDDKKCTVCGKFCSVHFCCEGFEEFKVGTEVDIFVCVYSPDYLKKKLYMPKKYGDSKCFQGIITKIMNNYEVMVKIKYKKITMKIHIDELETR